FRVVRRERWDICTSGNIVMRFFSTPEKNRVYIHIQIARAAPMKRKCLIQPLLLNRVSVRIPMCRIEAIP
ncbi:MAG TPA: hypothetical protein PLV96_11440, partial [Methanoregulaceae archaeon]|nr:hypothetical protein [Methanoregulaceae archaeon]